MRVLIAAAAVVSACAFGSTASAAESCGNGVHVGACFVESPGGSYTCTVGRVAVGNTVAVCLIEWQP